GADVAVAVPRETVVRAEHVVVNGFPAAADDAEDPLDDPVRQVARGARDDVAAEGDALMGRGAAQLRAVERPLVGLAVGKPILGPEHRPAAHPPELLPVVAAEASVGAGAIRIVETGTSEIAAPVEVVPVGGDRKTQVERLLQ